MFNLAESLMAMEAYLIILAALKCSLSKRTCSSNTTSKLMSEYTNRGVKYPFSIVRYQTHILAFNLGKLSAIRSTKNRESVTQKWCTLISNGLTKARVKSNQQNASLLIFDHHTPTSGSLIIAKMGSFQIFINVAELYLFRNLKRK